MLFGPQECSHENYEILWMKIFTDCKGVDEANIYILIISAYRAALPTVIGFQCDAASPPPHGRSAANGDELEAPQYCHDYTVSRRVTERKALNLQK